MNKLFKFALAALPMLMLASCAKDDLGLESEIVKKSETRYLKVTLSTSTATPDSRAGIVDDKIGEYQDGTVEENKIRTLEFYFYDADKQFHSYVPMTVTSMPTDPTALPGEQPSKNPNIHGFYHCNVPVELVQGQTTPAYVVCIVNSYAGSQYQRMRMDNAQEQTLNSIYGSVRSTGYDKDTGEPIGDANYFGMSNSVYYGDDPVTGDKGVLVMAAPFTTDKLLTESQLKVLLAQAEKTGSENQNEIAKYTINIPVERYAVKINFDITRLAESTNMPPYTVYSNKASTTEGGTTEGGTTEGGDVQTQAAEEEVPIKLTFKPKGWAVNVTEKTFFFLKSFRNPANLGDVQDGSDDNPSGMADDYADQAQLDGILFAGWNKPTHKRCFWARTPGYYTDNYPVVADDVIDNREDNTIADYDLEYLSWNQCHLFTEGDETWKTTKLVDYKKETTMKGTRLTGEGMSEQYLPTASLPAVILVGKYTVEGASEGTDFYLYGKANNSVSKIYSGETEPIPNTKKIKEQMLFDQTILLTRTEKTDVSGKVTYEYTPINTISQVDELNTTLYAKAFTVQHPGKDVRGAFSASQSITGSRLRIAADIVSLQLILPETSPGVPATTFPSGLFFFNPNSAQYQEVTKENLTQVNLLLYQNIGGAHLYKDGMAYFSAPIQHWGWHRSDNFNTTPVNITETNDQGEEVVTGTRPRTWTEWDWTKMKTGDFGLVRNHIYTMQIGSITGLGTAISDPDVPIVPPADKVKYAVHFHVNIQKWAVLPTQEWNW